MFEMLRKVEKDQDEGEPIFDSSPKPSEKNNGTSLFSIPCLFVGFTAKALCDCDSARSPTSPLDSGVFSGFASSWWPPRSDLERPPKQRKCWCADGVGLGIVGSLTGIETHCLQNVGGKPECNNILLGSQLNINPQCKQNSHIETVGSVMSPHSSPTYAVSTPTVLKFDVGSSHFAIESSVKVTESNKYQSHSSESIATAIGFGPDSSPKDLVFSDFDAEKNAYSSRAPQLNVGDHQFSTSLSHNLNRGGLSVNSIELSEYYTCVITHGPNPKTKHIYGNLVFEGDLMSQSPVCTTEFENRAVLPSCKSVLPDDFLSFCHGCRKKLPEGEDIYMYRGDKAFCSPECRMQEIMRDEEMKESSMDSSPPFQSVSHDKAFFFPNRVAVTPEY